MLLDRDTGHISPRVNKISPAEDWLQPIQDWPEGVAMAPFYMPIIDTLCHNEAQ